MMVVVNIAYQGTQAWGTYLNGFLKHNGSTRWDMMMVVNIAYQGTQVWGTYLVNWYVKHNGITMLG